MNHCLRCAILSSFSLALVAFPLVGTLHAQSPSQTPPSSSDATPDSLPNQNPAQYSDASQQQPSTPSGGHTASNAWKNLLRDAAQMGMSKAAHGNMGTGGPGNGPGGGGPGGGGPGGGGPDGGPASMNSASSDNVVYGSGTGIHSNIGAGIGSSGFYGAAANNFMGSAPNAPGSGMQTGFQGGAGAPGNIGGRANFGSISQIASDLSRGLGASGHTNAATIVGALPSLNQMLRSGLNLPVNSSFGNFHLTYQSPFSLSNNFQMRPTNGYGSGFAAYDSPHAHNGRVDFSASAKVGMGSANSMSAGGNNQAIGSHAPGGRGPGGSSAEPSTSLSFHLAF